MSGGEELKERRTRRNAGGGDGGGTALHAVAEAGLRRLPVTSGGAVTVAVRLLRRNGDVGPCGEHQLGCACNTKHRFEQRFKNAVVLSFVIKRESMSCTWCEWASPRFPSVLILNGHLDFEPSDFTTFELLSWSLDYGCDILVIAGIMAS